MDSAQSRVLKPVRRRDLFSHTDKDILQIMSEDWQRSEDHYSQTFDDMTEDWKQFLMIADTSDEPTVSEQGQAGPEEGTRANLKLPTMRKHIATALSIMINSLKPDNAEWLYAYPTSDFSGGDYRKVMTDIEIYRQYRLSLLSAENMDFWRKIEGFLLQGLIFPWSIAMMSWKREGRWVRNRAETPIEDAFRLKEAKNKVFDPNLGYKWDPLAVDRPDLQVLHSGNTRPDPRGGMTLRDCAFLMDEFRTPWYDLYEDEWDRKTNRGIYFNLEELEEKVPLDDATQTKEEEMRQEIGEGPQSGVTASKESKDKESFRNTVRLRRYWTRFGVITADAGFNVIIGKRRYEFIPLYDFKATLDWTKFDAQSFSRLLRGFDDEKDMLLNYRLNNLSFGIDGVVAFDGTRINQNSRGKPIHPGTQLEFNGEIGGAVDIIRSNDVTQGILQDMAVIDRDAESVIGQSENTLGQYFGGGRRLATEVQTVAAAGAARGNQIIQRTQESIITPMMNDMTKLEIDKVGRETKITISDYGKFAFPTVTPEFIRNIGPRIRFMARGTSYVNQREIEAAGAMNFANMVMNNPFLAEPIDPLAMDTWLARRVAREPKPERLFKPQYDDKTTIPPDLELVLMSHGIFLEPHMADDDQEHLDEHTKQVTGAMETGSLTYETIQLLEKHIALTEEKITQKQAKMAVPTPGPVVPVLPGQEGSQMTGGTQAANLANLQLPGIMPPTNVGAV